MLSLPKHERRAHLPEVGRAPFDKLRVAGSMVGLRISQGQGCRLYVARQDKRNFTLETVGYTVLSTQMATGESRGAFYMDRLMKAVRQCGKSVTIKLQGEGKAALIEGVGYWQVLMPLSAFPSEVAFSQAEWEALEWVEEMLRSIRRGAVQAVGVLDRDRLQAQGLQRLVFLSECQERGIRVLTVQGVPMLESGEGQLVELALALALGKEKSVLRAQQGARDGLRDRALLKGLPPTMTSPFGMR